MKQQTASQEQQAHAAGGQADVGPVQGASLSEVEERVLECLRSAGGGLTARQLESRLASSSETLDGALEALLERKLVSRLNTIIPSYSARVLRAPVDAQ
jgi:hypothetical protein